MKRYRIGTLIVLVVLIVFGLFLAIQPSESLQKILESLANQWITIFNIDVEAPGIGVLFKTENFRIFMHFILYGIAVIPFYGWLYYYSRNIQVAGFVTVNTVILYALGYEVVQVLFTDRTFSIADIAISGLGSISAVLTMTVLIYLLDYKKTKKFNLVSKEQTSEL